MFGKCDSVLHLKRFVADSTDQATGRLSGGH